MELDIFIPSLNLAFEYQGMQHFKDHTLVNKSKLRQGKDNEKRKACELNGITLIQVPFWWDGSKDSLLATIFRHRAELVNTSEIGSPIPERWGELSISGV